MRNSILLLLLGLAGCNFPFINQEHENQFNRLRAGQETVTGTVDGQRVTIKTWDDGYTHIYVEE